MFIPPKKFMLWVLNIITSERQLELLTSISIKYTNNLYFYCTILQNNPSVISLKLRRFFFYFLVYGSSDPNFCILEKNLNFIFDFFDFLRCKKLPDFKKKN